MRLIRFATLVFLFILPSLPVFAETPEVNALRTVVNDLIGVLEKYPGKDQVETRNEKIRKIYYDNCDVVEMARNVLKSGWNRLSGEERKEFAFKYSDFVLTFILTSIEDSYKNNKVVYLGSRKIREKKDRIWTEVETEIEIEGKMTRVNFQMIYRNESWGIYDVEGEGFRPSTTFRSQFNQALDREGFKGLMNYLDKLIEDTRKEANAAQSESK